MKLNFTFLLLFAMPAVMVAQQLPNSDFESWTHHNGTTIGTLTFNAYDEPNNWGTGNAVLGLVSGASAPTEKTTDAHGGTYAAKLITQSISGKLAAGNVFTGSFKLNLSNPAQSAKIGIPYTGRPSAFNVYYKYTSVLGDSCAIYVLLFHKNATSGKRDTIGAAYFQTTTSSSSYSLLSLPINYKTTTTPDSIAVVFTSSAGGAALKGQVGSTLFIDDFSLDFNSTGTYAAMASTGASFYPNPATSQVTLSNAPSEDGTLSLYNSFGVLVKEMKWKGNVSPSFPLNSLTSGIYTAVIVTEDQKFFSEKLIVK